MPQYFQVHSGILYKLIFQRDFRVCKCTLTEVKKRMILGTPVNQNCYVAESSGVNTIHVHAAFPNVFSR